MRYFLKWLAIVIVVFVGTSSANAGWGGYTSFDVNLREGPSTRYRVIVAIPAGESVFVHGCLDARPWCDVEWQWHRGYIHEIALIENLQHYRDQIYPPIIIIEPDYYRDRYYEPRRDYRKRFDPHKRKKYKKRKKRKAHKKEEKRRKEFKKRKKKKYDKKRKKLKKSKRNRKEYKERKRRKKSDRKSKKRKKKKKDTD